MNPLALSTLVLSLVLGTMMTLMSHHWLLAWMGLEVNTLAIMPLMAKHNHPRAVEATTKYFLIQAAASSMVLFSSMTNAWFTGEWNITELSNQVSMITMSVAISMKLGLAPLHFWLPEVMQGLNLTTGLILTTWQKLAPIALLYQIAPNMNMPILMMLGLLSTLMGGWGALNQTQLRKIMAYSSTAHLGWMVMIISLMPELTILNLMIYLSLTTAMFTTLKFMASTKINTLATSWTKSPTLTSMSLLTLMSLAGLPPLTGFMPKWLILQELTKQNMPMIATMMALSALLSLFFYMRLTYVMTLTISPNTSNYSLTWRYLTLQPKTVTALMTTLSTMLLPMTPTLIILLS
uniref:NADH-ubiquinone oxidoreductase chain 2 n=1 Tax=Leiopelma hochstetteri TaxID=51644 RepID=A0A0F6NCC7_LEIHO|nr:NADH dehydrogenase subunit 2 [Leiopelma hochstetteri]AII41070.1 NADH dehydrogenase subunit 2 [Leiopelma hochstetteri]